MPKPEDLLPKPVAMEVKQQAKPVQFREENIQKPIDIVTNISKNNPFDFEVEIPNAVSPKAEIAPSIPSSQPDPFNFV